MALRCAGVRENFLPELLCLILLLPFPFLIFFVEGVDLHAEVKPHAQKHTLNFVQRFAAEILGLEHLGFSTLHQFTHKADIGAAQAVGGTNGKLKIVNAFEQMFVQFSAFAAAVALVVGYTFIKLMG